MKYLLIILIVYFLSIPIIFAEEWSVYKNVDNEWIEVKDAKITTEYTISSGGHVMVTKTFINENDEEGEFAFNVSNNFEWDISSIPDTPDTEQPKQFLIIIIVIGLVTVAGTLLTYLIPQPKAEIKR